MGNGSIILTAFPGVHTQDTLVIEWVVVVGYTQITDGLGLSLKLFVLQFAVEVQLFTKSEVEYSRFEGGVEGIERPEQAVNDGGNPLIKLRYLARVPYVEYPKGVPVD